MRAARQLGISVRRFGGWEPKRVTTLEYDGRGRVVRAVTETESEWDGDERELMLAYERYEALTCQGCGGWLPETTSADARDLGYEVQPPSRCERCTDIATVQDQHGKDHKHLHALRWEATLRKR